MINNHKIEMKRIVLAIIIIIMCEFLISASSERHKNVAGNEGEKERRIDSLMIALNSRGQFTGSILIADHGKLIYKKAFGLADRQNNILFTPETKEYIGSVSKQFTAMGIMILKDRGKLEYDEHIRVFFPELPVCMEPVTIRHLLYHISGLALFDDYPNMTEKDVFNILMKQESLRFSPGEKFEYCNAGYSLLGMIIEKISGESLNEFMKANIFKPLGMDQTFVNEISHPDKTRAIGYTIYGTIDSYDTYMGGNASIISTVDDLYKWDQELYHCKLVKPQTLAEGFTPSSVVLKNPALNRRDALFGEMSYGYGWWIGTYNNAEDFHHDGAFSGYISYVERIPDKKISVIELSNLRHMPAYEIRTAILNIMEDKPYTLPKINGSYFLHEKSQTIGMDSAIALYRVLKKNGDARYDFGELTINSYAYFLLRSNQIGDAIKVFKLNVEDFPNSSNVYDGLGDGYLKAGDKIHAIKCYEKESALDPSNENLKKQIQTLKASQ